MVLKYKIGDILDVKSGKIEILGRYKNEKQTFIKYKCLSCGCQDKKNLSNILKTGCRVCANQKVVKGINDMWTTNPKLASLLANPDDGNKYTQCSTKRVNWICPNCKQVIKNISIRQIYTNKKISCPKCSDGISYPNKFMMELLKCLNINFQREFPPDWFNGEKRLYDFLIYINKKHIIIEMDGGYGHGNKDTKYSTKEEQIKRDNEKDIEATKRDYKVIRIDSNYIKQDEAFEYIKQNILNSELANIIDLSSVNWMKIQSEIETSNVKKACWLFNNKIKGMKEISEILGVAPTTVSRYLKRGNDIGLCSYSSKNRYRDDYGLASMHKVKRYEIKTGIENIYDCVYEASEKSNVHRSSISRCCNGKIKSVKGYVFSYC